MAALSEEEILSALIQEVELLAAEGESALDLDQLRLAELKNRAEGVAEFQKNSTENQRSAEKDWEKADVAREIETEKAAQLGEIGKSADGGAFPPAPVVQLPEGDRSIRWNALREMVLSCPVCNAHVRPGKKVVFGVGSLSADIFFCGEAPGADEEIQGEPFVGRAGQLLTKIIEAMGLFRSDVYIANVLNWRPEMPTEYGNRPPTREEMQFCFPYLLAQLEIVAPRVIVALGATASGALLGQDGRSMGEIRGRWHDFNGTPLMATYHPSYLLRYSGKGARRTVWEDILLVMERLAMPISEKQRGFFL